MPDEPKLPGESYAAGNVGAGARVAVGKNISWTEGVANLPDGEALKQRFVALLERISGDTALDEDARELAKAKTLAVAQGLAEVQKSPGALRLALQDARSWFGGSASWIKHALGEILDSESAQKTIATLSEASTKAVITSFLG